MIVWETISWVRLVVKAEHRRLWKPFGKRSFKVLPSLICRNVSECLLLPPFFSGVTKTTEIQSLRKATGFFMKKISPYLFGTLNFDRELDRTSIA